MEWQGPLFRLVWLAAVLGLAALAAGCAARAESTELKSEKQRAPATASAEELTELVAGNNAFAFDLYHELAGQGDNLFFSPGSISLALAMTYAGAREATEGQMAETLHFSLPQAQLHPAFNSLDTMLSGYNAGGQGFQLNIANAIWGQEGYEFLQAYLDTLAENYGAGLQTLDFSEDPDAAAEVINTWVSDQTEGKIEDLIPPGVLNSLVRLVLTNAIYFNGKWLLQFEESATGDDTFHLLDGGTVTVPMMAQTESFRYAEGDGYQAVALPYQGAPMSMVFVLPAAGRFEEIERIFSVDFLNGLVDELDTHLVELTVPKFKFDSQFGLSDTLAAMGMPAAFDSQADFSGMTGSRDLFISDVVHKAYVAVDEEGTEAAAATAVIMAEMAAAPLEDAVEMKLDRPFLFLIRDDDTGTTLFAGRLLDPSG